jgi:hypothetical protein
MKLPRLPLLALAAIGAIAQLNAQTTVATDPVGFTTISITNAGSATGRRASVISIPLLVVDPAVGDLSSGTITAAASNSITVSNANWTPGALSQPASPYVIQITSGAAAGRMFLVASSATTSGALGGVSSANTSSNLFISSADVTQITNLPAAGVTAGNTFRLFACDTLGDFFGSPATTGIRGGTAATNADNIIVTVNNTASTYYYNTSSNAWLRSPTTFGASNVALVPNNGVVYNRLGGSNSLSLISIGQVPVTNRVAPIRNAGTTVLSQYWPVAGTLRGLGIQNLSGWVSTPTATSLTDNVVVTAGGTATTYYYNGTNWRRTSGPTTSQDTVSIPIGSAVQVIKKGNTTGFSSLTQSVPYTLN